MDRVYGRNVVFRFFDDLGDWNADNDGHTIHILEKPPEYLLLIV
jgi:hypothetical protein